MKTRSTIQVHDKMPPRGNTGWFDGTFARNSSHDPFLSLLNSSCPFKMVPHEILLVFVDNPVGPPMLVGGRVNEKGDKVYLRGVPELGVAGLESKKVSALWTDKNGKKVLRVSAFDRKEE